MAQETAYTAINGTTSVSFVTAVNDMAKALGYTNGVLATDKDEMDSIFDPERKTENTRYVRVTVDVFDTMDEAFGKSVG